jgi:hypothetical protein
MDIFARKVAETPCLVKRMIKKIVTAHTFVQSSEEFRNFHQVLRELICESVPAWFWRKNYTSRSELKERRYIIYSQNSDFVPHARRFFGLKTIERGFCAWNGSYSGARHSSPLTS